MTRDSIPALPLWLGLAGLLPFVASLAVTWMAPIAWQVIAVRAFLAYGAVILSFLGGIQWGVAMCREDTDEAGFRTRMLLAMVPSLVAWSSLLLHPITGVWVLAIGFVLIRLFELSRKGGARLPDWYQSLRRLLTLIVVVCHGLLIWRLWGT
jgi:hypothetical protein